MKKLIYGAIILLLFPALSFSQKAKWQKTSDGRSILTEKEINNPSSIATKINITDENDRVSVAGAIYYVRDYEPWDGLSDNVSLLNQVYGSGGYTTADYSINPATLFSAGTSIVYLEGSDANGTALSNFLAANITAAQDWVTAGGHLFMNAAPNEGGNIDFGFGGTVLNFDQSYFSASPEGFVVSGQEGHPVFNGPYTPVGTAWTGNYFSHAYLSGGSATPLIDGDAGTVLSELAYGSGYVLFGGMTTANFHSPQPEGDDLRANIYAYLTTAGGGGCGSPTNLKSKPLSSTSAKLSWDAPNGTIGFFRIFIRVKGTETIYHKRKESSDTKVVLNDLPANTTFEWAMRSVCDDGTKSPIIYGPDFSTLSADAGNVRVFPNPVKNNMQIDGLSATQKTKLSIVDVVGNVRLVTTITGSSYSWNLSTLKAGNYLLKVETNNTVISRCFVKE